MHIGIDARMYGPEQGGLGRYIQQLIQHLEIIDTENQYTIFLNKKNWDYYLPKNYNFKKVMIDIPWYGWKEQFKLPLFLKRNATDLMHFPHWNVPLSYNKPFVVTIHDLLLLHYPTTKTSLLGPLTYWTKYTAYRMVLAHAAKKARHIITVSNYSKQDIQKTLHTLSEQISVTPLGPTISIKSTPTINQQKILDAYGIKKPYILYVGVAFPHKNLSGLLKAWNLYQERYNDTRTTLVFVGKTNYFYQQLSEEMGRVNKVLHTGFIPDDELGTIYQNSSLYVMPSFYEGSALPSLEAIAYNIPVISSNTTCLPEILGNGALYFNPANITEIAETINQGLKDTLIRQQLITSGRAISSRYSWQQVAKQTKSIYEDATPFLNGG